MQRNDLPFEALDATELEDAKADLMQVLNSLGQKEVAADVMRGASTEMFYKVCHTSSTLSIEFTNLQKTAKSRESLGQGLQCFILSSSYYNHSRVHLLRLNT